MTEMLAPTPERVRHAAGLMEPPVVDQRTDRRAWRLTSIVARMHSDGLIDDGCLQAYEGFATDWTIANSTPSSIGAYGEQTSRTVKNEEARELHKMAAYGRTERALARIGCPRARLALVMAVSPRPSDDTATERPYSLEDIGRACGQRNRPQAKVAGEAHLAAALYQLSIGHTEKGRSDGRLHQDY